MTLWFLFLWTVAMVRVLCAPLGRLVTKGLWLIVIATGIWLIVGAIVYQSQYAVFALKQKEYEDKKTVLNEEKKKLETLLESHPTSRDILVRLTSLSFQYGEREKMLGFVSRLREIDPNHPLVKSLIQSLQ